MMLTWLYRLADGVFDDDDDVSLIYPYHSPFEKKLNFDALTSFARLAHSNHVGVTTLWRFVVAIIFDGVREQK